MNTYRSFHVVLLVAFMSIPDAEANGINPPRPAGSEIVQATCVVRKSGATVVIQRARMTVDESGGLLEVRLDQSTPQTVPLAQFRRIQFHKGTHTQDGFAKSTLDLINPPYEGEGLVRVRTGGKAIRINGFDASSRPIELPLERCKELVIETMSTSDLELRGAAKK